MFAESRGRTKYAAWASSRGIFSMVVSPVATQVTEVVIPHAGHWLMEEQPAATMTAIRTFLDAKH